MLKIIGTLVLMILELVFFFVGLNAGIFNQEYAEGEFFLVISVVFQLSINYIMISESLDEIKNKIKNLK